MSTEPVVAVASNVVVRMSPEAVTLLLASSDTEVEPSVVPPRLMSVPALREMSLANKEEPESVVVEPVLVTSSVVPAVLEPTRVASPSTVAVTEPVEALRLASTLPVTPRSILVLAVI